MAEARRLLDEIDGWAVGLPLVALISLLPLFALIVLMYGPFWQIGPSLYVGEVSSNLVHIALGIGISVVMAVVVARACHRERLAAETPRVLRAMGHWAVIPAAFVLGLIVMVTLGESIYALDVKGILPAEDKRQFMAIAGTVAIFAPFTWLALLIRRREHTRLGLGRRRGRQ